MKNPIIVAIDTLDLGHAKKLANDIQPHVGLIKLGLEFFIAHGADGVKEVTQNAKIPFFLDLKLYDIPNTVAGGVRAACDLGAEMFTIHAGGGSAMMRAAVDATKSQEQQTGKKAPMLLGVSVLTSMDRKALEEIGVPVAVDDQVLQLAALAVKSGLNGLVCSSYEVEMLKREFGNSLKLVVPGIRPEGAEQGDQKRTMTPQQAIKLGADYLVIGRPITQSDNPISQAKEIYASL